MQQMIGASGLTLPSPVIIPTRFGAERVAQLEELLGHERLDRRGVDAAFVAGEGDEVRGDRHQRLAGTRRRVEDHVAAGDQVEDGLLLRRVHLDSLLDRVRGEAVEQCALVGCRRHVLQDRRKVGR